MPPETAAVCHPCEKQRYARARALGLQQLFIGGVAGAYFAAVAQTVPVDLAASQWSLTPDWSYVVEVVLRYAYLVWFLIYFFAAGLLNERDATITPGDVTYDLVQASLALTAAYCLGFIAPDQRSEWMFVAANGVIVLIAGVALLFGDTPRGVQALRWCAAVLALVGCAVAFFGKGESLDTAAGVGLGVILVGLFIVLGCYWNLRVNADPSGTDKRCDDHPEAKAHGLPAEAAKTTPAIASPISTTVAKADSPAAAAAKATPANAPPSDKVP